MRFEDNLAKYSWEEIDRMDCGRVIYDIVNQINSLDGFARGFDLKSCLRVESWGLFVTQKFWERYGVLDKDSLTSYFRDLGDANIDAFVSGKMS